MSRIKNLMRWLNVFVIFATFLSYLAPYFSPEKYWLFSVFGVAFPGLLIANCLFVLFWGMLRKPYFLLSLGCIIMGWTHVQSVFGFHSTAASGGKPAFQIMSYNMHNFGYLHKAPEAEKKKRMAGFEHWINKMDIDVICGQEESHRPVKVLDNYPYTYGGRPTRAIIYSKYPFLNTGTIRFKSYGSPAVWADIKIDDKKTIRIYSIHLHSNQINPNTIDHVARGKIQEKETWVGLKGMIGKYKRTAAVRAQQASVIADHIAQSPYPVILGGDFNEPSLSYAYYLLSKKN